MWESEWKKDFVCWFSNFIFLFWLSKLLCKTTKTLEGGTREFPLFFGAYPLSEVIGTFPLKASYKNVFEVLRVFLWAPASKLGGTFRNFYATVGSIPGNSDRFELIGMVLFTIDTRGYKWFGCFPFISAAKVLLPIASCKKKTSRVFLLRVVHWCLDWKYEETESQT